MKLFEIVTKAFCINLYFSRDRWIQAEKQFANNGLNVQRFEAIDGREFKTKYQLKPGNCGCNLSHFTIIQQADIMGLDAIMVFEDDVELRDGFVEKISICLEDLPDQWDLVMLAGSHVEKPAPVTKNLLQVKKSYCSHAYIMRSTVFKIVLERMKHFDQPLDCIFTELQKTHNVYVTNPPMAWQFAGVSLIEGKVMDYDWLKTNEQ